MRRIIKSNASKAIASFFGLALSVSVWAEQDSGIVAVEKANASPARASTLSSVNVSALQSIKKALKDIGLELGSKKTATGIRIISTQAGFASVEAYDPDFLQIRESLAVEAMLAAKRSIIESISSDVDALQSVVKFDNPVMKQLQEKQNLYQKAIEQRNRQGRRVRLRLWSLSF